MTVVNRRIHHRTPVLWEGSIVAGDKEAACAVLNVSSGGVKVKMLNPEIIPARATLRLPKFGHFRTEIAWREAGLLGLRFLEEPADVRLAFQDHLPKKSIAV